jgi:hypothetical protein
VTGSGPGERRRRGRGGASTPARIPTKCGGELVHVWVWKLSGVLRRSSELLVGHRRQWREGISAVVAMATGSDVRARAGGRREGFK